MKGMRHGEDRQNTPDGTLSSIDILSWEADGRSLLFYRKQQPPRQQQQPVGVRAAVMFGGKLLRPCGLVEFSSMSSLHPCRRAKQQQSENDVREEGERGSSLAFQRLPHRGPVPLLRSVANAFSYKVNLKRPSTPTLHCTSYIQRLGKHRRGRQWLLCM
nr:hypothetical protein CFP56_24527 [Quercus suber]